MTLRGAARRDRVANSTDKTLKLYPRLVHDLLHEPEKEMVMTDIEEWIARH